MWVLLGWFGSLCRGLGEGIWVGYPLSSRRPKTLWNPNHSARWSSACSWTGLLGVHPRFVSVPLFLGSPIWWWLCCHLAWYGSIGAGLDLRGPTVQFSDETYLDALSDLTKAFRELSRCNHQSYVCIGGVDFNCQMGFCKGVTGKHCKGDYPSQIDGIVVSNALAFRDVGKGPLLFQPPSDHVPLGFQAVSRKASRKKRAQIFSTGLAGKVCGPRSAPTFLAAKMRKGFQGEDAKCCAWRR